MAHILRRPRLRPRGTVLTLALAAGSLAAAELARFEIREPLGQTWTDEWLSERVTVELGDREVGGHQLQLVADNQTVPAQFLRADHRRVASLHEGDRLTGTQELVAHFKATIPRNATCLFRLTDDGQLPVAWTPITMEARGSQLRIRNGVYELEFDAARPLPINTLRCGSAPSLGRFSWSEGLVAESVRDEWIRTGPARVIFRRRFQFRNSPTSARISLGDESETIHLGTEGTFQAAVARMGKTTVLLKAGQVPPLAQAAFKGIDPNIDRGGL